MCMCMGMCDDGCVCFSFILIRMLSYTIFRVRASYDPTDQYILSTTLDHTHRIHRRHMLSSSQQHTTPSLLPSYDTHKPTHLSVYGGHTNVAYNVWSEVGYVGRHMRVWSGGDDGKVCALFLAHVQYTTYMCIVLWVLMWV